MKLRACSTSVKVYTSDLSKCNVIIWWFWKSAQIVIICHWSLSSVMLAILALFNLLLPLERFPSLTTISTFPSIQEIPHIEKLSKETALASVSPTNPWSLYTKGISVLQIYKITNMHQIHVVVCIYNYSKLHSWSHRGLPHAICLCILNHVLS